MNNTVAGTRREIKKRAVDRAGKKSRPPDRVVEVFELADVPLDDGSVLGQRHLRKRVRFRRCQIQFNANEAMIGFHVLDFRKPLAFEFFGYNPAVFVRNPVEYLGIAP